MHRPDVLFLDEPTTGLDPEARADMWEEIEQLTSAEGISVLLTTHYLEEADRLASRLAIVDRGNIVAAGTPDELKSELHGDALVVELAASVKGKALDAVSAVDGVSETALDGRVLRARADVGARALPAVLAALDAVGVPVATATVSRPSLDDVYLRHAGRTFEEAER
jgi:ABC-2 type transport system ATP-binding protein